jgi:hypothetical protein
MPTLDRAGTFNAQPYGWTLRKPERSQAIILDIAFLVLEMQNVLNDKFEDITRAAYEVKGSQWIVGNDGKRQDRTLETLVRVMNWSGDLEQFRIAANQPGSWAPPIVQIKVEHREWTDKKGAKHDSYEAKYINPIGWRGQANAITELQFAEVKAQLDRAGLGDAVAAIKGGKAPPPPPTPVLPMVTPASLPTPTMPTATFPSLLPPTPPIPNAAPWDGPPGTVPFTGQF